jgi:hypothetical protein
VKATFSSSVEYFLKLTLWWAHYFWFQTTRCARSEQKHPVIPATPARWSLRYSFTQSTLSLYFQILLYSSSQSPMKWERCALTTHIRLVPKVNKDWNSISSKSPRLMVGCTVSPLLLLHSWVWETNCKTDLYSDWPNQQNWKFIVQFVGWIIYKVFNIPNN